MIGIYKITSPSNKVYVGQSWDIEKRLQPYRTLKCKGQPKLYYSLKKYGWEAHRFEILQELDESSSQEHLDYAECFYMTLLTLDRIELLNCRGGGSKGKLTDETKLLLRNINLGKTYSDETKEKLRKLHTGRIKSPETREKLRIANLGKTHSLETKKKISESHKGINAGEDNYNWGQTLPQEQKDKISIARRGKYNGLDHHNARSVLQFTKSGEFVREWDTITQAVKETSTDYSSIIRCCKGTGKTAGGFTWKYKEDIK